MDFVEPILSIITQIYSLAENVKANKDRCQRVAQRSKALQELVLTIKQRGPDQISTPLENALRELCASLEEAKTLMMKFSQTKGVKSFWKSGSHEEKFNKVNERLTDNFQVLSGALQIEHGTMLSKVYQTVSGRSFNEEYYSGQDLTTPTSPTPVPSAVPQMPVSSPTSPMAPPAIMPQMPVSSSTSPTAPPAIMPQMPVSSSTSPMAPSAIMPPMQMSSPTSPMAPPAIMPQMPVSSSTSPMAPPAIMPPMQMSSPPTIMPLPGPLPPMQISSPTTPMPVPHMMAPRPPPFLAAAVPLRGTMAPIHFPAAMAPRPALASVSHVVYSPARIVAPVQTPVVQMTSPTQTTAVVRVPNGLYFS